MKCQKIKIAQVGIGHNHGHEKMLALRKLPELFDIVGVVEPDPVWRAKRGGMEGYKELTFMSEEELFAIPDLAAVTIETDGKELLPTALRCAKRGLHLHMDKPGGQHLQGFQQLVDCCRSQKLALQLAYIYRYNPAIQFCMDVVKSHWIGEIFEIHAVMSRYDGDSPDYRKWLSQFQGGAMYIFAGYLLDLVISMLGTPQKIHSFLKQTRHDGLVDSGLAVLEYDIATATVRVSVEEVDGYKHRRLIICGTEGTLELCPIEKQEYYTQPLSVRLTLKHPRGNYEAGTHIVDCGCLGDRYAGQLTEFARIVRGEICNPYSYEHELALQTVLLQICGINT